MQKKKRKKIRKIERNDPSNRKVKESQVRESRKGRKICDPVENPVLFWMAPEAGIVPGCSSRFSQHLPESCGRISAPDSAFLPHTHTHTLTHTSTHAKIVRNSKRISLDFLLLFLPLLLLLLFFFCFFYFLFCLYLCCFLSPVPPLPLLASPLPLPTRCPS